MESDVDNLELKQKNVEERFDNIAKEVVSDKITTMTKSKNEFESGYIQPNGTVVGSTSQYHYNFAVESGEVISVKKFYINSSGVPKLITDQNITAICAYTGETPVESAGKYYNANAKSYTVPDGIDNITISFPFVGTLDMAYIIKTIPNGETNYYFVQDIFKNPLKFNGNLPASEFKAIGEKVCVDEYILTAICPVNSSFSSLKLGGTNAGQTAIARPYIEITPTQIKMYSNTDSSFDKTVNHGLTITNDLQVFIIAKKDSLYFDFIVQSNGAKWTNTEKWRFGTSYNGFGVISETTISNFSASISVRDLYKPVWVCGDSWVTLYDTRWYGQAINLNFVHFLHSGHSGEGSADGLIHLKTLLSMFTPKLIVWLYGMNDDDTDNSTPNSDWLTALNELKTICDNKTIELVLATIPTTPTRNMNAKNVIVRASGYRYVDEVSAMGADDSGNWITGYQSEDGNHTTVEGAQALLAQVLSDVPEIALS